MNSRRSSHQGRTAPEEKRSDAVQDMRRRLEELLSAAGPAGSRLNGQDPGRVRPVEGGSTELDIMGIRPNASDPQRTRSAGFRTARDPHSHSAETEYSEGRWADPVAAGSERGARAAAPAPPGGTVEQAKEACLRLLAVRARSRAELVQRLAAKGYTAEIADRALDRLAEVGLIDDAAFAEQWVHARHTYSGKGKQALAQELRRKGVDPADAAPALDAITSDDEADRARELVRRKLRSTPANLDRDKTIRRLVGMLARRGYSQSTAYSVVKSELAQAEYDTDGIDVEPD